jgi:hypothetical protein
MERKFLESTAANYPYLQGLWVIPLGFMVIFAGISNLEAGPSAPWLIAIFAGFAAFSLIMVRLIERLYRSHYGEVTPTRERQKRSLIAFGAWVVVLFIGANRFLFWSPDSRYCVFAVAFAAATLVYYAILTGLRPHQIAIWGAVLVAALLPIWGRLGDDRDPVAMMLLGVALIASGVLDQRLLGRSMNVAGTLNFEANDAGR